MKFPASIQYVFFCIAVMGIINQQAGANTDLAMPGTLNNQQCIECHEQTQAGLVTAWQNSRHASAIPVVDCLSCHGDQHDAVKMNARRDKTCTECHGGAENPVVHSYSTSKHGVLMRIEGEQQDWKQPLQQASYRMPGCSYCHMHAAEHDVSASVRKDLMTDTAVETVQDKIRAVCQDCHSPRYITRLLENGEAMLEIGRKKIREADSLISQAANVFSEKQLALITGQRLKMQQHLTNVYLGAGHQSPDYQWWHGQPSLDGDLLRIKGLISDLRRTGILTDE